MEAARSARIDTLATRSAEEALELVARALRDHPACVAESFSAMAKKSRQVTLVHLAAFVCEFGRRGGIRTRDPLHPMQVRYQAALHAEQAAKYSLK